MAPRDPIPLRAAGRPDGVRRPRRAMTTQGAESDLKPFERGPEITEIH